MPFHRRRFVTSAAAAVSFPALAATTARLAIADQAMDSLSIAPFRFDATPPIGHACCGGWIPDISVVDDALEALGFVLLGAGSPIVICALDWCALSNSAHLEWRRALAAAAGTTPDRVAVHCVHQHNTPFACLETEKIVAAQGDLPHVLDVSFFHRLLDDGRRAVERAVREVRPCTHVAVGTCRVDRIASNRRVARDADGRVTAGRTSACTKPELIALPEGLVDPVLRTVAFYDGAEKVVSCHYYATHPMSYYADGRCTSDFAGLARKRRQRDEPGCLHAYFTGCAGDVTAGKYNDGSPAARVALTQRLYDGIVGSESALRPEPVRSVVWRTEEIVPTIRASFDAETIRRKIGSRGAPVVERSRPAYMLAWLERLEDRRPILLSSLSVNAATLLHLPAECFVEYQLRAQKMAPDRFVATAAYGDGGPWYVPVKEEYAAGGYEISVAFSEPGIDELITGAIRNLIPS
jgi:hypothetical protein